MRWRLQIRMPRRAEQTYGECLDVSRQEEEIKTWRQAEITRRRSSTCLCGTVRNETCALSHHTELALDGGSK